MKSDYSKLLQWLESIKVIGFDLDDTLWNNTQVILNAIDAQYESLRKHLPNTSSKQLEQCYNKISQQLRTKNPQLYQNVTQLRQDSLALLCEHYELSEEHASHAFDSFYQQRQKVLLYPEVLPLLKELNKKYKLMVISNGNSSLKAIGLAAYFDVHWQAGRDGEAKPSGEMLKRAVQHNRIEPTEFLYVGDNFHTDGRAVVEAGVRGLVIPSDPKEDLSQANELENIVIVDSLSTLYQLIKGQ